MKQALPIRSWANGPIREERKKEKEKKRKPYWPATAQLEGGGLPPMTFYQCALFKKIPFLR
jgi:hypothetical protein